MKKTLFWLLAALLALVAFGVLSKALQSLLFYIVVLAGLWAVLFAWRLLKSRK